VAATSVSAIESGPTGLTTVLTGAMAMRVGAILRPCETKAARQVSESAFVQFFDSQHPSMSKTSVLASQGRCSADLAGDGGVIGTNDNQGGRDRETLWLHINTCVQPDLPLSCKQVSVQAIHHKRHDCCFFKMQAASLQGSHHAQYVHKQPVLH
jgi:hypothetical protein